MSLCCALLCWLSVIILNVIILSVVMLSAIMLSVVMLNVIILNFVAPIRFKKASLAEYIYHFIVTKGFNFFSQWPSLSKIYHI